MKSETLKKVTVPMSAVLGTKQLSLEQFSLLKEGSILALDSYAGEPVTLMAGGQAVALAEVVIIDENFGVRVIKLLDAPEGD